MTFQLSFLELTLLCLHLSHRFIHLAFLGKRWIGFNLMPCCLTLSSDSSPGTQTFDEKPLQFINRLWMQSARKSLQGKRWRQKEMKQIHIWVLFNSLSSWMQVQDRRMFSPVRDDSRFLFVSSRGLKMRDFF